MKISAFWFRRDLRLEDNTAFTNALNSGHPVMTVFIFDENILNELLEDDPRVSFIYNILFKIHQELKNKNSSLLILKGKPVDVWGKIISEYNIKHLFYNKDYEPYTLKRDREVNILAQKNGILVHSFKDQVIFEEDEIIKNDGNPYTIYTPYKKRWLSLLTDCHIRTLPSQNIYNYYNFNSVFPSLSDIGFRESAITPKEYDLSNLKGYDRNRDLPGQEATSNLSTHLRFGTVSIRQIIRMLSSEDETFLSELIWREFFMQILFHYPEVVSNNFRSKYNGIQWRNNKNEFEQWCLGKTGYPFVDAGMRQLNQTGFIHNRARMVAASFLCKHLLIDWRWGEAYFAQKLLDYELASNNGNWQWAAGTGCDAAPYFRIFNPNEQAKKYDRDLKYIRQWIPEFGTKKYPIPMIDHKFARERAINLYKKAIINY